MLKEQFNKDLKQGKQGEQIVARYLQTAGYQVEDVSDKPQDYHNGDLLITLPTGQKRYVEVKDDTVISTSGRILCEEEVYYKKDGLLTPGFMYRNYDIYAVVSEDTNKIYFFDFAKLKQIYKKYFADYRKLEYSDQYSICYFVELCRAKQFGALLDIVNY